MDWERSPIGLAGRIPRIGHPGRPITRLRPRPWSHATYRLPPVLNPSRSQSPDFSLYEPLAADIELPLAYFPLQPILCHSESPRLSLKPPGHSADRQSTCKICITSFVCKLGKYFSDHGLDRRGRDGRASFPTRTCSYIVSISPFAGHSASTIPPALCLHTCFPCLQRRGIVQ